MNEASCIVCSMSTESILLVARENDLYIPIPYCGGESCREVIERIVDRYEDVERLVPGEVLLEKY